MRLLLALIPLSLTAAAFAAENESENIFNADLSNPDLALTVSHFEETCMPFVLHKSEIPQHENILHREDIMERQGFAYKEAETLSRRILVDEAAKTEATVFIDADGGVIMRGGVPQTHETRTVQHLLYVHKNDNRLSAELGWNYPSQNHPGKSCVMRLQAPSVTQAQVLRDFIVKDNDWQENTPGKQKWSQCVRDGDDEFLFTAHHMYKSKTLSLHVKRNDFYDPDICPN